MTLSLGAGIGSVVDKIVVSSSLVSDLVNGNGFEFSAENLVQLTHTVVHN